MTVVRYAPGDPQYLDHVLLDLSRGFIVSKEGSVNQATDGVILRLLAEHVLRPLRREHTALYTDTARTFPSVRAYQEQHYLDPEGDAQPAETDLCADQVHAGPYVAA